MIARIDEMLLHLTFRYRPHGAEAYGHVLANRGFLVLAGSTAIKDSSATKKRDREERERLVRQGVLVDHGRLLVFVRDQEFTSASRAAGIIKDGNASGPQLWIDIKSGRTLSDFLNPSL
ncbi:MAG TPA: DUF4357 domain-containing protein [Kaistia sp.]|nr:DUF4357 domain-containing protein [Kaistia sp.]